MCAQHTDNHHVSKYRKEGELNSYIQKLNFPLLKSRLIKEARATEEDFARFYSFFEFNLRFYRLELEELLEKPGFNDDEFNRFVNVKFREAVFEFKRFLAEDAEFKYRVSEDQYENLFNNVYKINPAEHTPNQPMAAGQPCQNMDFSNNTTSWVGKYCRGLNGAGTDNSLQCWNGFGNGQYTKMTGGNDGNFAAIPRVPPGASSSLRLGDMSSNNDKASILQTFRVTSSNYMFVYKWAAVLNNNGAHPASTSPYFKVRMYRFYGTGSQQEISCATVDANSQTATSWGFSSSSGYRYKNWTTMFIPLSAYIGEDITIWFESSDCIVDGGSHEGYAYIWASCLPPNFTMSQPNLCAGGTVSITAPAGASAYSWWSVPPGGISGNSNTQTITATQGNTTYYVQMTTNTQPPYVPCSVTLDTMLAGGTSNINPNFNPAATCAGTPTYFTDLSTPSNQITNWSWDFNNDGVADATTQTPSYTFPSFGTYPVKLTVSNGGACPKDTTINVQVLANPVANFSVNPVCIGDTSIFQNSSTPPSGGSITGSDWDFGDGFSSSSTFPKHAYTQANTYQVTLTVTSDNGCFNQITKPATVNALPTVDAGLPRELCFGASTTLIGSGANSYSWSNGVANNVVFTPAITTVYTVWGKDANQCVNTDTVRVEVNPNPVADFSVPNVCVGFASTFTQNSTISQGTISSYSWNFGDGNTSTNPNPTNTYTAPNTYSVFLQVTSNKGCIGNITKSTTVNPLPNVIGNSPKHAICLNESTTLNATGAATYSWNPAAGLNTTTGNTVTANPTATTIYTVTGPDANTCVKTDTVLVTVNPLPIADFTGTNACLNQAANTFTDLSTVSSGSVTQWQWTFTGQPNQTVKNPTVNFSASGTKNVTLIVTTNFGCKDTVTKTVEVYALPVADFTSTSVCKGFATSLVDASVNGSGNINSYHWNYGDNNTGTGSTTTNTYSTHGTFQATLYVADNFGCKDTITKSIIVHPLPVASFSSNAVCALTATSLTNTSTVPTGSVTLWNWDINHDQIIDATTSSTTYSYTSGGTYPVYLQVATDKGCRDSITKNVIVHHIPVADFTGTNACLNQAANVFTDLSTVNTDSVTQWQWTFAGQPNQTVKNPTVNFSTSGIKNVTLIVTTNFGCKDTVTKTVEVYALPVADFTSTSVCKGFSTTLTSATANGSGSVNSYNWEYGDGNTGIGTPVNNTYSTHGTFQATLYVSDNFGCKDTITKSIIVHPLPVAAFSANSVCALKPTLLNSTSTVPTGSIVSWNWDINNDQAIDATTTSTTYTYTSGGTYPVYLQVATDKGCRDSITKNVNVNYIPVADYTVANKCVYDTLSFHNQSTIAHGTIADYDWIFGDGSVSSDKNPFYQYASCGVKATTLVATSDSGCVHAATKQLTVYCKPQSAITLSNVCASSKAFISGTSSTSSDGTIAAYNWNFGNGQIGTSSSANVPYVAGNYTIKLTVTSSNGCVDTISKPLTVYPVPKALLVNTDSCLGIASCFHSVSTVSTVSSGSITAYCWDFNNDITTCEANDSAACKLYSAPGVYPVKLIVTTDKGCSDTTSKNQEIYPLPSVAFTAQNVCLGKSVTFANATTIP
ncbi:MAG: PKD domain-containing protein, partial [Bacteroidia bacterium]|nr:PKD domain-containing protein [Bacteroidia bacterium]